MLADRRRRGQCGTARRSDTLTARRLRVSSVTSTWTGSGEDGTMSVSSMARLAEGDSAVPDLRFRARCASWRPTSPRRRSRSTSPSWGWLNPSVEATSQDVTIVRFLCFVIGIVVAVSLPFVTFKGGNLTRREQRRRQVIVAGLAAVAFAVYAATMPSFFFSASILTIGLSQWAAVVAILVAAVPAHHREVAPRPTLVTEGPVAEFSCLPDPRRVNGTRPEVAAVRQHLLEADRDLRRAGPPQRGQPEADAAPQTLGGPPDFRRPFCQRLTRHGPRPGAGDSAGLPRTGGSSFRVPFRTPSSGFVNSLTQTGLAGLARVDSQVDSHGPD